MGKRCPGAGIGRGIGSSVGGEEYIAHRAKPTSCASPAGMMARALSRVASAEAWPNARRRTPISPSSASPHAAESPSARAVTAVPCSHGSAAKTRPRKDSASASPRLAYAETRSGRPPATGATRAPKRRSASSARYEKRASDASPSAAIRSVESRCKAAVHRAAARVPPSRSTSRAASSTTRRAGDHAASARAWACAALAADVWAAGAPTAVSSAVSATSATRALCRSSAISATPGAVPLASSDAAPSTVARSSFTGAGHHAMRRARCQANKCERFDSAGVLPTDRSHAAEPSGEPTHSPGDLS